MIEKDIHEHIEEITLLVQVEGQNESLTTVGTEETPEQITQAQEKRFDKDFMHDSKNSTDGEIPCSSATVQLKGDQMEVSHEDMMQDEHIQNVELNDQMEPSFGAAALMAEGVHEHKTLDTHEVSVFAYFPPTRDYVFTCTSRGLQSCCTLNNVLAVACDSEKIIS